MTIRELREVAKELGIKNYSKLRKPELEQAIAAAKQGGSKQIGSVNGQPIIVVGDEINGMPVVDFLASLSGFNGITPAGARRRVRKLLAAAGHRRLTMLKTRPKATVAAA